MANSQTPGVSPQNAQNPPTLAQALELTRASAGRAFAKANAELDKALNEFPDNGTPEDKQKAGAKIMAAQGLVSSAISQLTQAEETASQQDGRKGYADAVALMQTTARAAEAVCGKIADTFTGNPAPTSQEINERLKAMATLLAALASLSPVPIWQGSTPRK